MDKNVAIINTCDYGSTGKIALGLFRYLRDHGDNVFFYFGRGEKHKNGDRVYRFSSRHGVYLHAFLARLTGSEGDFSWFSTWRLLRQFKRNKINLVYAINLHGYYLNHPLFFRYLHRHGIRLIYIMADEYPYLGKCTYSGRCDRFKFGCGKCPQKKTYPKSLWFDTSERLLKKKERYYEGMKGRIVFVGPQYTMLRARESRLLKNQKLFCLDEAVDTSFFFPRARNLCAETFGVDSSKTVVVCVAPSSIKRKNVPLFIELAKRFENDESFLFVEAGYSSTPKPSLKNLILFDFISSQEHLARLYSLADLFVFPSSLDTMPNACLEALACGSPLLCFDISGMSFLGEKPLVNLVPAFDLDEMERRIRSLSKKTPEMIDACRNYALTRYNSEFYFAKLRDIGECQLEEKS